MSYTHTTREELRDMLAARLDDTAHTQWLSDELDSYISSTLSRWATLTSFWRARGGPITTTAGTAIYPIDSQASLAGLTDHTRTDRDELGLMQYMLREPYDPIDGTGMSTQFGATSTLSFERLVGALQRARDQFLADTLGVLTLGSTIVSALTDPALPDTVLAIRRAVWLSSDNAYSNLHLTDESEALAYSLSRTTGPVDPGVPELYSPIASPPLTLKLYPPVLDSGTLHYLAALSGAALDPATEVVLGVPDDWCWIVRALALSDLLSSDGQAYDPSRAAFCRSEYELGVTLAVTQPFVLSAEINGIPVLPSSLFDLDMAYSSPHWQSLPGTPTDLGIAGDHMALRPVPDSASHSVVLDLVRKAPQPAIGAAGDTSQIEVGREDLGALLDGAQALALFKQGGVAIDDAARLMRSMTSAAVRYNSRLAALGYGSGEAVIGSGETSSRQPAGAGLGLGTISAAQLQRSRGA